VKYLIYPIVLLLCLAFAQSEFLLLDHHQKGVNAVAFAPDGRTLVTSSDDSTARVWNALTGEIEMKLSGHTGWVLGAAINGNGNVATSDSEGRVALWDISQQKLLRVWTAHNAWIRSLAFSDDGLKLVTAADDFTAKIWEVSSGKLLRTLTGHTGWLTSVFFVQNQIVTASRDGTVKFWISNSGTNTRTLELNEWIYNLALSPDGVRFATAAKNGVRIWNRISGRELEQVGFERITYAVAFSPDGTELAIGNDNGSIDLWDAKGLNKKRSLLAHTSYIKALAYSPDSRKLASASRDGMARIWNMTKK
jgi:WD40 repeat protein